MTVSTHEFVADRGLVAEEGCREGVLGNRLLLSQFGILENEKKGGALIAVIELSEFDVRCSCSTLAQTHTSTHKHTTVASTQGYHAVVPFISLTSCCHVPSISSPSSKPNCANYTPIALQCRSAGLAVLPFIRPFGALVL